MTASKVSPLKEPFSLKASKKGEHGSCCRLRAMLTGARERFIERHARHFGARCAAQRSVLLLGLVTVGGVLSLGLGGLCPSVAAEV